MKGRPISAKNTRKDLGTLVGLARAEESVQDELLSRLGFAAKKS